MKWSVNKNDLNISKRKLGISGFMRVRNEEEWISLAIESHLPFLDEIIVVYNRCTDATPEIVEDYAKKYKKVVAYKYEPDVYPQGSKEAISLPTNSPNSLANYYNFALCKTTKKIALKVDGDQIAIPKSYKKMISFVKKNEKKFPFYYRFRGLNLYYDKNGNIAVQGEKPKTGIDRGFFSVNKDTEPWHIIDRTRGLEILKFKNIKKKKYSKIGFYHTKGLKEDKGKGNYDLRDNPNSRYHSIFYKEWADAKVISCKKYIHNLPHPSKLGIK